MTALSHPRFLTVPRTFLFFLPIIVLSPTTAFRVHSLRQPLERSNVCWQHNKHGSGQSNWQCFMPAATATTTANTQIHSKAGTTTTSLSASLLLTTSTLKASSVLIGSSLAGCLIERRSPNTGILTTMVAAALCSNLNMVPSQHYLYDLCWTSFLPASLAFLLLAKNSSTSSRRRFSSEKSQNGWWPSVVTTKTANTNDQSVRAVVMTMSIPFALASIGSIMGCTFSFAMCRMVPQFGLRPNEAALAASCLCASFIGGTVNFFATAKIIGSFGDSSAATTLMSSMAAADLLVMAVYFGGMALALRSTFMSSLFSTATSDNKKRNVREDEQPSANAASTKAIDGNRVAKATIFQKIQATTYVSVLAFLIVRVSSGSEKVLAPILPGTACAAIAVLSPMIQRTLLSNKTQLTQQMQSSANVLSEFCLQLLFASIGTSAKLKQSLLQGPACLCFSLVALTVHIAGVLGGSVLAKRWFHFPLQLEDALVASNAAIGGPATAAAFAGRIDSPRQRGLTMAGTAWGVIGYAVGTTIGVSLYSILVATIVVV